MKVLVNGCSHLAGTELHDNDAVAHKFTWPNFVQDWQIENISQAAASNDSIVRRTIDALETNKNFDLVYIQWSHFNRIELQIPFFESYGCQTDWFCINGRNARVKADINNNADLIYDIARSVYLKQFDKQWFANYNLSNIIVLQNYCEHHNIPYRFGMTDLQDFDFASARGKLLAKNKFVACAWQQFCEENNFEKIIIHYGQEAHYAYAKYIESLNFTKEQP